MCPNCSLLTHFCCYYRKATHPSFSMRCLEVWLFRALANPGPYSVILYHYLSVCVHMSLGFSILFSVHVFAICRYYNRISVHIQQICWQYYWCIKTYTAQVRYLFCFLSLGHICHSVIFACCRKAGRSPNAKLVAMHQRESKLRLDVERESSLHQVCRSGGDLCRFCVCVGVCVGVCLSWWW